jgi:hypothetical protein
MEKLTTTFARNFDSQSRFDNEIKFLLSFEPSEDTKNADFAAFNILFESKRCVDSLLSSKLNTSAILTAFPSCMETLIRLNRFNKLAKIVISEADNKDLFEQNYEAILNANYKALKNKLDEMIKTTAKKQKQNVEYTQPTLF